MEQYISQFTGEEIDNAINKTRSLENYNDEEIKQSIKELNEKIKNLPESYDDTDLKNAIGEIQNVLLEKVDKKNGYSLMLDEEKERLSTVKNYDDTAIKEDISSLEGKIDSIKDYDDTEIRNEIAAIDKNKVEKIAGKSLISDEEIERLSVVKNYDDAAIKQDINRIQAQLDSASTISYDDTEIRQEIGNKVDKIEGYSLISNSEIERLNTVKNYDDTAIKEEIHSSITSISEEVSNNTNAIELNTKEISNLKTSGETLHNQFNSSIESLKADVSNKISKEDGYSLMSSAEHDKLATITNPMLVKGKLNSITQLNEIESPQVGWVYIIDNEEYVYTEEQKWESFGPDSIDLSGYYNSTQIDNKLDLKVDKENGYGLISNEEKNRLSTVKNYDDSEIVEKMNTMSTKLDTVYNAIQDDSEDLDLNERFNKKVDKEEGRDLSSNDYTTIEKTKLAGIAENANRYVLPTASTTLGGVKTTSSVTSTQGYFATPIISGVPYYKDTTYSIASSTSNGLMSSTDKTKLDNLETYDDSSLVAALENKVDKVSGKELSTNDYTTTEKTKLAGIEQGAQKNVTSDWLVKNGTSSISNKPNILSIQCGSSSAYGYYRVAVTQLKAYTSLGMTIIVQPSFNRSVVPTTFIYDIAIRTNDKITNRAAYNQCVVNPYGTSYQNNSRNDLIYMTIDDSTGNVFIYAKTIVANQINYVTIVNAFANNNLVWTFQGSPNTSVKDDIESGTATIYAPTDITSAKFDNNGNEISKSVSQAAINKSALGFQKKNLLNMTATSKTQNGLTFTVNEDKTITVNGTATANTTFTFNFTLPQGSYIASGCPEGGSTSTYNMPYYNTTSWAVYGTDTGKSVKITIPEERKIQGRILIYSGQVCENMVFKPMIRYAEISDDTYEVYSDDIQTQINNILGQLTSSSLKSTVISLDDYNALTTKDENMLYIVTEKEV